MRLPKFIRTNTGFTLIELLVVIAVLGILAAVVLVAIDPQQRIAEAQDAGTQSNVSSLAKAVEQCFTAQRGSYDNCDTTGELETGTYLKNANLTDSYDQGLVLDTNAATASGDNIEVIVAGELRSNSSFVEGGCAVDGTEEAWYVYSSASGESTIDCIANADSPYDYTDL